MLVLYGMLRTGESRKFHFSLRLIYCEEVLFTYLEWAEEKSNFRIKQPLYLGKRVTYFRTFAPSNHRLGNSHFRLLVSDEKTIFFLVLVN